MTKKPFNKKNNKINPYRAKFEIKRRQILENNKKVRIRMQKLDSYYILKLNQKKNLIVITTVAYDDTVDDIKIQI
jgi:hypothetical protein